MSILKRGSTYQPRRRVPQRYRRVEPHAVIWISLHTDSGTVARSKADRAWGNLVEAWEARLAGDSEDAEARHAAAHELARIRGFRYLDVGLVSRLSVLVRIPVARCGLKLCEQRGIEAKVDAGFHRAAAQATGTAIAEGVWGEPFCSVMVRAPLRSPNVLRKR